MELPRNTQGIGIPFYSEADWPRAKAVMVDGHTFPATYAEFTAKVEKAEAQLRRQGTPTIRVYLRLDEFLAWCRAHGRQVDTHARADFAALKAREQDTGHMPG